jgi:hypothetical protein
MVISASIKVFQYLLGDFEKNTRDIGSNILIHMGDYGEGIYKICQGIISSTV